MARQEAPDDQRGARRVGTAFTRSPEKFLRQLEGAEWPARKEDLLRIAQGNAAPPEVVRALERLPGEQFANPDAVWVAYESMM